MNQRWRTIALWVLPIGVALFLGWQVLGNGSGLAPSGPTVAPRNAAVARMSYGRFLDYVDAEGFDIIFQPVRNSLFLDNDRDGSSFQLADAAVEQCFQRIAARKREGSRILNALLQAASERDMQGRINAIANLTKGLQSLSLASASYLIHLLATTHHFGRGYQPVQVSLALGLLIGVALLWPRLRRFALR